METISYQGEHTLLATTKKYTTGEPHYIEVGHLEPAPLSGELQDKVKETVFAALTALKVENGAGHSELRIDENGNVRIIEIGSRMGGDCIGSDLVPLSTEQDFVGMVVDVATGNPPQIKQNAEQHVSAVRFIMNRQDLEKFHWIEANYPETIRKTVLEGDVEHCQITDSGSRPGFYILQTETMEEMNHILHRGPLENPIQLFETPVQRLRIHDGRNTFYMKRDDLLPFSFGGNKVRFARKYVENMQAEGYDSMVIYGNYHSNLCRILASLCNELSIPCYMVHNTEDVKETKETGNSRIIRRMNVHEIPCEKKNIAAAVRKAMAELTEKGFRPYYIYGNEYGQGNEWPPMKAYEEAYEEILSWEKASGTNLDYIFLASSTNATQSGLMAGKLQNKEDCKIVGISVSRNASRGQEVIENNLREYAERFSMDFPEDWEKEIEFTDSYMEGGYGAWSEPVATMIRKVYETDGVYLDMTYTGKAFYGMMKYLQEKNIQGKNILFLHTGGLPLFFDFLEDERT